MNKPDLQELIDRYESGHTSLEEEQTLSDYFNDQRFENEHAGLQAQFVYFKHKKNEVPSDVFATELHGILEQRTANRLNVRFLLRIAAMLMVVFGIGWLAFSYAYRFKETISTGPDQGTRIALPDGTIVFLNNNSELVYNREFDGETRTVHLKGEAYFEVQRDISRPFVIHTGGVTTEVLGTSFNLRYYKNEDVTEVSVNHGRVRFGADQKVIVTKGEGAIHFAHERHVEVTEANANADAWKTGKLTFENAKMTDVIRDIERYFQIRVEIKKPSLLNCHFTGEFSYPGVEDVLKVISYSLNIRYTVTNGRYVLSGQSCQHQ